MASQAQESIHKIDKPPPSRKVAREACADASATDALREFLKNNPNPIESLSPKKTGASIGSNRPSSRVFFKNILRNNKPLRTSTISRSSLGGLLLPHNCVVIRQAVPGQDQQYYRIVRDSSQLDSLETKSTFVVNYQFNRHDINKTSSDVCVGGKKDEAQNRGSTKDSLTRSASTRIKHCFRIQARSKRTSSPERKKSIQEKILSTDENSNQNASSLIKSLSTARQLASSGEAVPVHLDVRDFNPQTLDILHQDPPADDVPQIGNLTSGKAFPASDLIRSWGRRRSIQSTKSSPSRIQGIHRSRISSPMASIVSARASAARPPLPTILPKNPARNLPTTNLSTSPSRSAGKAPKKLASPVKLSAQKSRNQQILNRPRPRMRELAPMALTSNPSNPSLRSTSPDVSTHKKRIKTAIDFRAATIATSDSLHDAATNQHSRIRHPFTIRDDLAKAIDKRSPTKSSTAISVDLGMPTTPPPRTPLPAVPVNSHGKILSYQDRTSQNSYLEEPRDDLTIGNRGSPLKSTFYAAERTSMGDQKPALQLPVTRSTMDSIVDCHDSDCEKALQGYQEYSLQQSSNVSDFGWPQPPKISPVKDRQQLSLESIEAQATEKVGTSLTRKMQTDSLKRRHLRNTQEQIQGIRNSSNASINSRASLLTIIERAAQQDVYQACPVTQSGSLFNNQQPAQLTVDRLATEPAKKLSFSNIQTYATIEPKSTLDSKLRYKLSGRIVYRSHSTQMTPRKHSNRFGSGSSTSNDETLVAHYLHQQPIDNAVTQNDTRCNSEGTSTDIEQEITSTNPQNYQEDAILSRLEKFMSAMEDRLYKRLSEELSIRYLPGNHQHSLEKAITTTSKII